MDKSIPREEIEIKASTPEDRGAVFEMYVDLCREESSWDYFDGDPLKIIKNDYDDLKDLHGYEGQFVAYKNREKVGFIWILISRDEPAGIQIGNIVEIFVKKEFRGQGIAKKMLNFAEEYCRKKNLPLLRLNVSGDNTTAQKIYKEAGYGIKRYIMEKRLQA